eukprot:CAMPEP_0183293058 /NCGR_PEP_ID=MMETSP0160_2-20130417/1899_1 /TAXON_ID=2839 ORGANISM="Odontella Sinensis, Strain Grunow 1884" /NCGR_SAMPLE_ID=MMETSP0160_2 /ASSEMBLY_ACC=CAM_ASM_000250 /LENGTH=709 /DNA_ID=CAMNT_0025454115 /DNA_START=16 /DNA_END=2145 /DNA_ORIENTATION=+
MRQRVIPVFVFALGVRLYATFVVTNHVNQTSPATLSDLQLENVARTKMSARTERQEDERSSNRAAARNEQQQGDDDDEYEYKNRACEILGGRSAPMALWTTFVDKIFAASRHPTLDPNFVLHDATAHVLKLLTPRLPLAQRSVPRDWRHIGSLMDKVGRRVEYLNRRSAGGIVERDGNKNNASVVDEDEPPPPVRILVLGGSVTMGFNCWTGIRKYTNYNCAWPARLENLVNRLVSGGDGGDGGDGKLVEVYNAAVGSTNTATGTALVEFDLLPPEARNPDVVINAYSTNDMHILSVEQARSKNMTLRDATFEAAQEFARAVLGRCSNGGRRSSLSSSRSPSSSSPSPPSLPPLLLWLDDYLGNEQREILATTELSQSVQVLANYYGFGFVSYADAVRDLVYGTSTEVMFSPAGWYRENRRGMFREIHPGATMHIAASYAVAYYLLNLGTTYCSLESWDPVHLDSTTNYTTSLDSIPTNGSHGTIKGLPALLNPDGFQGRPKPRPTGLPPPLDSRTDLENVSKDWKRQSDERPGCTVTPDGKPKCPFSWVSGISQDVQWNTEPQDVFRRHFASHVVPEEPSGWGLIDDRTNKRQAKKFGFVPTLGETGVPDAVMTMKFAFDDQEIRILTVFYLKSYGDKWTNSSAQMKVVGDDGDTTLGTRSLTGFHDKRTSEMYTDRIDLSSPTRNLTVTFEHTGGTTFKLMGIAVCS